MTIQEPRLRLVRTLRETGSPLVHSLRCDLARGMGGDIHLVSIVGEETTFTVDLPRA